MSDDQDRVSGGIVVPREGNPMLLCVKSYDSLLGVAYFKATPADLAAAGYVPASQLADVLTALRKLTTWCRSNYLYYKGLPDAVHEAEELWNGHSLGANGDAHKSASLRRAEAAESQLADVTAKLKESERKLQLLLDERRPSRVYELAEKLETAEGRVREHLAWLDSEAEHFRQNRQVHRTFQECASRLRASAPEAAKSEEHIPNDRDLDEFFSSPEAAKPEEPCVSNAEEREFRAKFNMPASPPSPARFDGPICSTCGDSGNIDEAVGGVGCPATAPCPDCVARKPASAPSPAQAEPTWAGECYCSDRMSGGLPCLPWKCPNVPAQPPAAQQPAQAEPSVYVVHSPGGNPVDVRLSKAEAEGAVAHEGETVHRYGPRPPAAPGTPLTVELQKRVYQNAYDRAKDRDQFKEAMVYSGLAEALADELERGRTK